MNDDVAIWVVYCRPDDFPNNYVVRIQRVTADGTVVIDNEPIAVESCLEDARAAIPPGLLRLDRHPKDVQAIAEMWL